MSTYTTGLMLGGFNPPHKGHFELMLTGLERVGEVHIAIGRKPKYHLSYDVRAEAISAGMREYVIDNRTIILPPQDIFALDTTQYDLLLLGSDVFNLLDPEDARLKPQDKTFFAGFPNIVALERQGLPIDERVLNLVRERQQVEIVASRSSVSASLVRTYYREGRSVEDLLPLSVKRIIDPHAHLFLMGYG